MSVTGESVGFPLVGIVSVVLLLLWLCVLKPSPSSSSSSLVTLSAVAFFSNARTYSEEIDTVEVVCVYVCTAY